MTLTHPDTPTSLTAPPSPGDLALALTKVHAAATNGDLDGYTTSLQKLHAQTAACLRAAGAGFQCDSCDTPIDLAALPTWTPVDESPAGRTASNTQRVAVLYGRLVAALGNNDVYATVTSRPGEGCVQIGAEDAWATARLSLTMLPGGRVKTRSSDGYLWVETFGVGIDQGLSIVCPVPFADQEAARAWLATIGITPS